MFAPGSTKEQIFDVVLDLIAQKRYENVSIKDIAKHVGIAVFSIYNHFVNKENILYNFYL